MIISGIIGIHLTNYTLKQISICKKANVSAGLFLVFFLLCDEAFQVL